MSGILDAIREAQEEREKKELEETYRLGEPGSQVVQRLSDNAWIPFDEGNGDYRKYLRWIAAGKKPLEPEVIPEPTPEKTDLEKAVVLLLKNVSIEDAEAARLKEELLLKLEGKV